MYDEDTQNYVCSISPTEFELFCMEVLEIYAKEKNYDDFVIEHNVKKEAADGIYQLDIYARFTAFGVNFEILCECKQYSSPVKRERVELLESRLKNLGMHKGILISTSGFQSGAVEYAKIHGISLVQMYDNSCRIVSHDGGPEAKRNEYDPFTYIEDHWPPYRVECVSEDSEKPLVLYPTREIVVAIYTEANKLIKEQYGIDIPMDNIIRRDE